MDYIDILERGFIVKSGAVLLLLLLVFGYYYKFKDYFVNYEGYYDSKKRKVSKSLPAFTNGWFITTPEQLLKQDKTVSEVCFLVGYDSLSTFSGLFSKTVGKTPLEFLNNNKQ